MYIVSRTNTFAKLFFLISVTGFIAYIVLAFYSFHRSNANISFLQKAQVKIKEYSIRKNQGKTTTNRLQRAEYKNMKYILQWIPEKVKEYGIEEGQIPFIGLNCTNKNCWMTSNKLLLKNGYNSFDAIVFDLSVLKDWVGSEMPQIRQPRQKYIFRGLLPSGDQPICDERAENYFNLTWSYKLYSDIFNPFFVVVDFEGEIVAPSPDVEWPVGLMFTENLQEKHRVMIQTKKKAVAWIMKQCSSENFTAKTYAKALKEVLSFLNLNLDIYGCDNLKCSIDGCDAMIKRDYYFYLVFEDSISEDYVSKEVLKAFKNYAVPIVVSGADLTKFLPPDSYINGRYSPLDKLPTVIQYSIKHTSYYQGFHIWRNRYIIREADNIGICQLCAYLNDGNKIATRHSYSSFRMWWLGGSVDSKCKAYKGR